MTSITDEEIKIIENRLNNSPRKRLVFRTPAEVFHQPLSRVALRALIRQLQYYANIVASALM